MLQDVRYAVRMLALRPAAAAATVVLLATAIAASVVTFCLADAILWHPVPFRDPERVVNVHTRSNPIGISSSVLDAWAARDQVLSAVYSWSIR